MPTREFRCRYPMIHTFVRQLCRKPANEDREMPHSRLGRFVESRPFRTVQHAAPLYFDFNQVGAADIVTLNYPAAGLNGGSYYAGQYQVETSPNSDFSAATSFNTFCVDLFDDVNIGQQYLVNPLSTDDGLTNGAAVAYLYNTYGTATISRERLDHLQRR